MPAKAPRIEVGFYGIIQKVFQEKKRQVDLSKGPNIQALLDTLCNSHERREKILDEELATTEKSCIGCVADEISWEIYYLLKEEKAKKQAKP